VICLEHVAVEVRCSGERGRCRRLIAIAYEIPAVHREGLGGVLLVVPACESPTMYHVVPADFAGYVYDRGPLPARGIQGRVGRPDQAGAGSRCRLGAQTCGSRTGGSLAVGGRRSCGGRTMTTPC
jgi:hypothetical protein